MVECRAILGVCVVLLLITAASTQANEVEDTMQDSPIPQDISSVRCFVVSGMIIMIPKEIDTQILQDITDSMLFLQLAANAAANNRNNNISGWANAFDSITSKISWNANGVSSPTHLTVNTDQFTLYIRSGSSGDG